MNQNQLTQAEAARLREAARDAVKSEVQKAFALSEIIYGTKNGIVRVKIREGDELTRFIMNEDCDVEAWVPVWAAWGYKHWEDYLREELQMSGPTARVHLRVWEVWGIELKNRWDKKRLLPISKMYALTDVALTTKKLNPLLDAARGKTLNEIRAKNPVQNKKRVFKINVGFNKRDHERYERLVKDIEGATGTPLLRDSLILAALETYLNVVRERPWLVKR